MARNSFIQINKLGNLKGRIDYITNPKRQENLYAVYNTTDDTFWHELARCNSCLLYTSYAGNKYNVPEISHLGVGNFRLYLGIGMSIVILAGVSMLIILKRKRKVENLE